MTSENTATYKNPKTSENTATYKSPKTSENTACDSPMIRLCDVTLGYDGKTLVKDINASFNSGEVTCLVGRNGSGKSTLLRAIAGLNNDYTGEIIIDGSPRLSVSERARTVAFVNTARVRIANMTSRDIVALGRTPYTNWIGRLTADDDRIVDEALGIVGMEAFADRSLDTMSDGEAQRIMIARALAQSTPVILLDEPTSFLDIPNRFAMMRLLADLAHRRGKCVILSTHELDIALQTADRLALIADGRMELLSVADPATPDIVNRAFSL